LMRPIVWTEPWYTDAHNNIRHTHLLSRFTLVDPLYQYRSTKSWQGKAHSFRSKSGLTGQLSQRLMGLYWHFYAKNFRAQVTFRRLSKNYQALFCTSDHLYQTRYFKGSIVIDDDDPTFTRERIDIINSPNVAAVVTTSEQLKARLLKEGLRKDCYIIPSGVDFSSLQEESVRSIGSK